MPWLTRGWPNLLYLKKAKEEDKDKLLNFEALTSAFV
jgi:hypothetical protein